MVSGSPQHPAAEPERRVTNGNLHQLSDDRAEPRDEVLYRTRAVLADRRTISVVAVNVSQHGLMLRSDAAIAVGEWIKVQLPVIGTVHAAVRWALGGRIGCQLDRAVGIADYHPMLLAMRG